MAGTKVTSLAALTALADGDVLPAVDVSDTAMAPTGTTKKTTIGVVTDYIDQRIQPFVNAAWYGASPAASAADNKAALQAAIDEADGERPVYIPPGTYTLGGTRTGTFNAILTYVSGTTIFGDETASVLKIEDSYTAGGDYKLFAPAVDAATDNVTFRDFKIDCNGTNNTVAGSTGGDVRRAIAIFMSEGANPIIDNVEIVDCPGRNVICLGNNGDHDITNARITNCRLLIFGSGVPSNNNQNDCSAIYCQSNGGLIFNNTLLGQSTVPNPSTDKMTALEVHGSRTIVKGNRVTNCTRLGNQVATVMNSIGNEWRDNIGESGGNICLFSWATFDHRNVVISGNVIRLSGAQLLEAGIMAPPTAAITATIHNVIIANNVIESDTSSGIAGVMHGVYIATADGLQVVNNTFRNLPGDAVHLLDWTDLPMRNVTVKGNTMDNVGFGTGASRPWAIYIWNNSATCLFDQMVVDGNVITKSASAGPARGINVVATGAIRDLTIGRNNKYYNLANPTLLIATSGSGLDRLVIEPREFSGTTAGSPTSGNWLKGDVIRHTDVAASGTLGKVCTTAGGASSATWASSTAYTLGQWVKTSGNKFLECTVAGTSHASTEPNPTTLGQTITDGTVTWQYRDFVVAVFKTFGAVAA